uniref:Uncharacterized protein n=1 Tax=Gasterosteus aculeatus TaxID=69293 RepID=G3NFH2_GASAC
MFRPFLAKMIECVLKILMRCSKANHPYRNTVNEEDPDNSHRTTSPSRRPDGKHLVAGKDPTCCTRTSVSFLERLLLVFAERNRDNLSHQQEGNNAIEKNGRLSCLFFSFFK